MNVCICTDISIKSTKLNFQSWKIFLLMLLLVAIVIVILFKSQSNDLSSRINGSSIKGQLHEGFGQKVCK